MKLERFLIQTYNKRTTKLSFVMKFLQSKLFYFCLNRCSILSNPISWKWVTTKYFIPSSPMHLLLFDQIFVNIYLKSNEIKKFKFWYYHHTSFITNFSMLIQHIILYTSLALIQCKEKFLLFEILISLFISKAEIIEYFVMNVFVEISIDQRSVKLVLKLENLC